MIRHQHHRKSWLGVVGIVLLCLGFVPFSGRLAFGQVDQGAISGFVQDATGAVIANAAVTLTNTDTGLTLQSHTDGSGGFTFSPVKIGNYKLSATATGFSTTTQSNLNVSVQQHLQINLKLKPGTTSETVEVTSTEPLIQTEDASVGQVINQKTINDLPLNGRNFTFLAQLAAGVNTPQADTRGNAATGAFSANGLRPAQNNYLLDGIDNNSDTVDFLNGTNYVVLPPLDAIQEFKVQTSDFSAEFGRSGAAVLNASTKSGTNAFHGAAWEFFRNDALDAKDYFESSTRKGELRQNQYGGAIGGPIVKNKLFFFGDYEGLRKLQGTILSGTVPTALERSSGYTDLSDLITAQTGSANALDFLGRSVPVGTITDPATTRAVTAGIVDPISGRVATSTGFVRDPFGTCAPSSSSFDLATCGLNQLPAGRLDANAIKLLNLYPTPTNAASVFNNYANSPKESVSRKAFDVRGDYNLSQKDQFFSRFSYVDDPQNIPGIFGGLADGGAFQQGLQTAVSRQFVVAYTHVFTPTTINVFRFGLNNLHTTRNGPLGNNTTNIPSTYGILGIPQHAENGGLPTFGIGGLTNLGSSAFLPSDETSNTKQFTDDFTKTYGKHTFKAGFEYQRVKFSTLQPGWSRGEFDFGGSFTDIANKGGSNTGRAQFLLSPTASSVGGTDNVGGPNSVFASNISTTNDGKNYFGGYVQDDWKVSPKLTVNIGLRWDYFGLVYEQNGKQANFVPSGPPGNSPQFLIPNGTSLANLSSGPTGFTTLLAKDGIGLKIGNSYGLGLGTAQKNNFAPRFGFAYQATPKMVIRGGFGIFYNAFENRGYGPNIGENYPFVFNFSYFAPNNGNPIGANSPYAGCATASSTGTATLEAGLSCISFSPLSVNASGLGLEGIQFKYITPYTMSGNFTMQYQLTPTLAFQLGYVTTQARHLETSPGANNVTQILAASDNADSFKPFKDFGRGSSYRVTNGNSNYQGLQTKLEKSYANGLSFLFTYTWSKALSDAGDSLNGGSLGGYRAPDVPGFGIHRDYGLASFNIKNVVHISGTYGLPFGKGKRFMSGANGFAEAAFGGWSLNWVTTLQGGQPITLGCPTGTTAGTNCYALKVAGQDQKLGLHKLANGQLGFFGNPAAFTQPCQLVRDAGGNIVPGTSPSGCVPLTGLAALGGGAAQVTGPGFHRLDLSLFKDFQLSERFKLQFRSEFFNIFNHPNFNAPGFGGNGVTSIGGATDFTSNNFGAIGSTRDAPYDARQIQLGLKLYF